MSFPRWVKVGAATVVVAAPFGFVGWNVIADVLDLDGCDGPNEGDLGLGSCARPLVGNDFASGRASIDAYVRGASRSGVSVRYRYSNNSTERRSLEWTKLVVIDPSGRVTECWGDDSSPRYGVDPGVTVDAYGGCDVSHFGPGVYRVVYEGRRSTRSSSTARPGSPKGRLS